MKNQRLFIHGIFALLSLSLILTCVSGCRNEGRIVDIGTKSIQLTKTGDPDLQEKLRESFIFIRDKYAVDSRLNLVIKQTDGFCVSRDTNISLQLVFSNISNENFLLQTNIVVPYSKFTNAGSVFGFFYSDDGSWVHDAADEVISEVWSYNKTFIQLIPQDTYTTTMELPFPELITDDHYPNEYSTPSPGMYAMKLVYINFVPKHSDEWSGLITSNLIEICIR